MRPRSAAFGSLLVVLGVLPHSGQQRTELEWRTDLDEATTFAKKTGRPLLIEFR